MSCQSEIVSIVEFLNKIMHVYNLRSGHVKQLLLQVNCEKNVYLNKLRITIFFKKSKYYLFINK